jgi:hypothetical protein
MHDNYTKQLEEQVEKLEHQLQTAYTVTAGEKEVLQMLRDHYKKDTAIHMGEDMWMPTLHNMMIAINSKKVAELLGIKSVPGVDPMAPVLQYSQQDVNAMRILNDIHTSFWQRCKIRFKMFIYWVTHFEEDMQG